MPMLERHNYGADKPDASLPVDPLAILADEASKQTRIDEQLHNSKCSVSDLPKANLDGLGIWFNKYEIAFDSDKNGALSQNEIQTALQNQCLPAESQANLKLLNSKFGFFAGLDRKKNMFDGITVQAMNKFDGWNKVAGVESELLDRQAPYQSDAIKFLHNNFNYLDTDRDHKIGKFELSVNMMSETDPVLLAGMQNLKDNFQSLAEPTRSGRDNLASLVLGNIGPITARSVARFTISENANTQHAGDADVRNAVLANEQLQFNMTPSPYTLTAQAPFTDASTADLWSEPLPVFTYEIPVIKPSF